MSVLLGNAFSLLAMVSDAFSATRTNTRGILLAQTVSQLFYGISTVILKGYSGVVQNVVSVLRNLTAMGKKQYKAVEWLLMCAAVGFGLLFNNRGFIGLLPVVANLEYTVVVFRCKDNERAIKWAFLANTIMYTVFNFAILNFVGGTTNIVIIVTTAIALFRDGKKS